jgi:predicted nuclease of predicted toxin-antitoxin system
MKFLLDMPVSSLLLKVLGAFGHEGVHAHQIGKDRAPDIELLDIAQRRPRYHHGGLGFPSPLGAQLG